MEGTGTGTVTILVTDLVGSTALRAAVGENTADRLRQAHDRLLVDIVERRGGSVVKGLGDGILVTFSGAADAVVAAVEVQQAMHAWQPDAGGRQVVRVGISAGDVSWDAGDCFGTPVIEASRLCAAAEGAQILVAEVVRVLARGRHGAELTALGALDLKGLPEPVTTYEVSWSPPSVDQGAPMPLPAPLRTDREFRFAGRTVELSRLGDAWQAATAGERRMVVIGGEPGIGKTRLAAELANRAHSEGATVLYGRCDQDMGFSYQPFVDPLQQFASHSAPSMLAGQLGPHGGDLVRLCPDLATSGIGLPPPLRSDPEAERYRLFEAVAGWLRAVADQEPLVLVLDDLHEAAAPGLQLLRHVVRSTDAARLLILSTYRDTELRPTAPLAETLAELRRIPGVERLSLGGLDEPAVGALLDLTPEDPLTNAVYAETEGNPFFTREVLRHLQESGAVSRIDGRWVADRPLEGLGIPEGVREVVGRRLVRLSEQANAALSVASVAGMDFTLEVVALVHGTSEDELLGALDEAVQARLLSEVGAGAYRFSHALVRSTLYDEMGLTKRVRVHRRVGEALETVQTDDVRALAHHFTMAAAGGQGAERAARLNVLAAQQAQASLATQDAKRLAATALELLEEIDDDILRCDALTCLGQAERLLGEGEHREHLLAAARLAREHGDVERLVAATIANGGGVGDVPGVDADRIELTEAALEAVGPDDTSDRARLLAILGKALGAFGGAAEPRAFAIVDEALAVARKVGDPHTLTVVLHEHFDATQVPRTRERRLELSIENVELATSLADPIALGWALQDYGLARAEYGDLEEAFDAIERMLALGQEYGIGAFRRGPLLARASRALNEGRLADAEGLADQALQVSMETGHRSAFAFYGAMIIPIRRDQGRLHELLPLLIQASEAQVAVAAIRAALCMVYADLDQPTDALEVVRHLAIDDFASIPYDWLWLTAMCNCAEASVWLGDQPTAAVLLDQLAPYHDHFTFAITPVGSVARFLGGLAASLGQLDDADAYFVEAAAIDARAGARSCLARTRVDWARLLLSRSGPGDAERAVALLDQVLETTAEIGLPTIERRARQLRDPARG